MNENKAPQSQKLNLKLDSLFAIIDEPESECSEQMSVFINHFDCSDVKIKEKNS